MSSDQVVIFEGSSGEVQDQYNQWSLNKADYRITDTVMTSTIHPETKALVVTMSLFYMNHHYEKSEPKADVGTGVTLVRDTTYANLTGAQGEAFTQVETALTLNTLQEALTYVCVWESEAQKVRESEETCFGFLIRQVLEKFDKNKNTENENE